jgi:hypothetical protein
MKIFHIPRVTGPENMENEGEVQKKISRNIIIIDQE